MKLKCCWNEELKEWFDWDNIGENKYMCSNCGDVLEVEE